MGSYHDPQHGAHAAYDPELETLQERLARVTAERDALRNKLDAVAQRVFLMGALSSKHVQIEARELERILGQEDLHETRMEAQHQKYTALATKLDAALAMLRQVEWESGIYCGEYGHCPVCNNHSTEGHAPGCALAALLGGDTDD